MNHYIPNFRAFRLPPQANCSKYPYAKPLYSADSLIVINSKALGSSLIYSLFPRVPVRSVAMRDYYSQFQP